MGCGYSKLWNTDHAAQHVRPACERSFRDLGLDYLDLYLIHFPIAAGVRAARDTLSGGLV